MIGIVAVSDQDGVVLEVVGLCTGAWVLVMVCLGGGPTMKNGDCIIMMLVESGCERVAGLGSLVVFLFLFICWFSLIALSSRTFPFFFSIFSIAFVVVISSTVLLVSLLSVLTCSFAFVRKMYGRLTENVGVQVMMCSSLLLVGRMIGNREWAAERNMGGIEREEREVFLEFFLFFYSIFFSNFYFLI